MDTTGGIQFLEIPPRLPRGHLYTLCLLTLRSTEPFIRASDHPIKLEDSLAHVQSYSSKPAGCRNRDAANVQASTGAE